MTNNSKHKLSATALSTFLKSPKSYYWRYVARLVPIQNNVANYDHDRVFGQLWAEFTDRFYKGISEAENTAQTLKAWLDGADGWVPDKQRDAYTRAFETLMPLYYQLFSPDDGCRAPGQSELWLENDRFCAKLDGLSEDKVIHEVKSTNRAKSMQDQLWKVQNSIQVKLYAVLAEATGHCIEFAYKDSPHTVFRGPVVPIDEAQRKLWEQELNGLAEYIYSLGDDPYNYPCHPDGCCITSRFMNSICPFQLLCEQGMTEENMIFYKAKESYQSTRS